MGKDLVYFASNRTNATKNYAILKDAAGTYFHLRFDFHYVQEFWDNRGINAANISQAEIFAIGGENEYYIFFSVGGIIYGYNTGERRQFVALDLGPENQIGHMEFISNRDIVGSVNMLTVAYYNKNNPEGTGTVALYTVPVLNRPLIEQHKWTGMGKIVHVAYK
jgi:hypothetical protein